MPAYGVQEMETNRNQEISAAFDNTEICMHTMGNGTGPYYPLRRCSLKECFNTVAALRTKALERGVVLRTPHDAAARSALKQTDEWVLATKDPRTGWIVVPTHDNRGLPEEQWYALWKDMKVELEAQQCDGSWHDYFTQ